MVAIGSAAEPYYRSLWFRCSIDEKLALRQLAEGDLANPEEPKVVLQLMRHGS